MYGYDILIDSNCKPWLIEINASPSLTTTTKIDKELKHHLLEDVYNIVLPQEITDEGMKQGVNTCKLDKVGNFTVIYDESQDKKQFSKQQK